MDKIFIRGLQVETVIGVHAWEQRVPRPLLMDLELGVDARSAASSDAVRDAVDYAGVAGAVREIATAEHVALLETLAERIARALFRRFAIDSLRLTVSKPGAVTGVAMVGVSIERRREDYATCGS